MTAKLKIKILAAFIAKFEREAESLGAAAKAAHEAATHEESKAEDAHDTRGVEASYLAGAQTARLAELKSVVLEYKALLADAEVRGERKSGTAIAVGSLVVVQPLTAVDSARPKGAALHAIFAAHGGGTTVEVDGRTYSVFTPNSPIGEAILGGATGEVVEIESKGGNRAYRIDGVA